MCAPFFMCMQPPRTPPTTRNESKPTSLLLFRWKTTMQEHFARMHAVGERVAGLLSVGLGLDSSTFDDCFSEFAHVLRLLHYSAEVSYSLYIGRSSGVLKGSP